MKEVNIKQEVVDGYGRLAKAASGGVFSKFFACCDISGQAEAVGREIGYTTDQLASVPSDANLGVGCGNPAALADIQSGQTVVDLGSGAGFDAFIIAQEVGETGKVIGVDLSSDMIGLARKNAKTGNYGQVEFVKGDIEALPLDADVADHVVSNCVINLSQHKDKVYAEAYRVLKPGGRLSISDIVLERDLPDRVVNSISGRIACVSGAERLDDYLRYIASAGFEEVQIKKKTTFPLELMLADPQIAKLAGELDIAIDSEEARDIAARVASVSITAVKR
jgi:SAM-dependent methyltransferase